MTSSSSSIRSSYSIPSDFIAATASPRALYSWAEMTCRGSSRVASIIDTTSSAYVGDSRSSRSSAASANGDSGWSSAKLGCRSTVSRTVRPSGSGTANRSTTPPASSARPIATACLMWRRRLPLGSSLSVSRRRRCVERVAGAGDHVEQHRVADVEARRQRLGVGRDQPLERLLAPGDEAVGRLLALYPSQLDRVVARLGDPPGVLDLVLRSLHDDGPDGVEARPGRLGRRSGGTPGRAGDASGRRRTCVSPVSTTVRIGTLMPTPSVSVPHTTLSRPDWASTSTSRR